MPEPLPAGSSDLLFAYGSLMSGERAHALLAAGGAHELLGAASVAGRLYAFGAWPGLVPSEDRGERVHGELHRFERIDALLAVLDPYEDCPGPTDASGLFRRALVEVEMPHERPCIAWTYFYAGSLEGGVPIPSGRWRDADRD